MTPLTIVQYPFTIRRDTYTTGGACFVAEHPDLPGCYGYGDTERDAIEKLGSAREAYLDSLQAAGVPMPQRSVETARLVGVGLGIDEHASSQLHTVPEFAGIATR